LAIHNSDTGLLFDGTSEVIKPWNVGNVSARDAAIDLGGSTDRFKDLYLSGGVYLGGTGSANKLYDYETGTWTPVAARSSGGNISATYNVQEGSYVKIGNLVTVQFYIELTTVSGQGSVLTYIDGLPFAPNENYHSTGVTGQRTSFSTAAPILIAHSNGNLYLRDDGANFTNLSINWQAGHLSGSITYQIA